MGTEKTLGGPVEAGGLLNPPLPPNSDDKTVEEDGSALLTPPLPPNSGDKVTEPAETESDEQAQGIEPAQEDKSTGESGIPSASVAERSPALDVDSAAHPQKTTGSHHSTEPFYHRRRILIILAFSFMVFVLLTVGVVCYVMSSRGGQEGITSSSVDGSASGSVAGGRYVVSVDGAVASDDGTGVVVSVTWRNMGNVVDYMPDAVRVLQNGVALVRDKGYSDAHSMFMVLPGESVTVSYKYLTFDLHTDLEVQVGSKASGLVGTTVKIRGE